MFADSLALDRAAALARFGPPLATSGDTVRNEYDPTVLDSIVRLRFRLFESQYYVRADGVALLSHVSVFVPLPAIPAPVRVGASRARVEALLGPPDHVSDGPEGTLLLFTIPDTDLSAANALNVFLVSGRVRWLSWVFYLD